MTRPGPTKAPKFDTPARRKLLKLVEKVGGPTALGSLLGKGTIDRSQISRWCAGDSRPGDLAQAAIAHVASEMGIEGPFEWLTREEKVKLRAMPGGSAA